MKWSQSYWVQPHARVPFLRGQLRKRPNSPEGLQVILALGLWSQAHQVRVEWALLVPLMYSHILKKKTRFVPCDLRFPADSWRGKPLARAFGSRCFSGKRMSISSSWNVSVCPGFLKGPWKIFSGQGTLAPMLLSCWFIFEVKYVQYKQRPKAVLLMLLIKNKQKKKLFNKNCKICWWW